MQNKKTKLAFSLIELSVVILIIGILVLGITQASRIVKTSKLSSAQSLTNSSPVQSTEGLAMWLEPTMDKSFTTGVAVDTPLASVGTISTWNDISLQNTSGSSNATQSGASTTYPRYVASAINGLPAVHFDGNDFLNFNGSILANSDFTIFVVEQRRATGDRFFMGSTTAGPMNGHLQLGYGAAGASLLFDPWSFNSYYVSVPQFSTKIPKLHSYLHGSAIGKKYFINSKDQVANLVCAAFCATPRVAMSEYNNATIGQSAGRYFNGDIGEIIIFTKYLSDRERTSIETYLKNKWGIK